MPSSGLRGPYALSKIRIDAVVSKTSAGAYALGEARTDGAFYIGYVGRSDDDVNKRLKNQIGTYPQFKYEYYGSPRAAFEKECGLYHDFDPPGNSVHPARPNGSSWKCPRCRIFG